MILLSIQSVAYVFLHVTQIINQEIRYLIFDLNLNIFLKSDFLFEKHHLKLICFKQINDVNRVLFFLCF